MYYFVPNFIGFFLQTDVNIERMHAAKECKASSVLSKFKEMEKRVANGEDLEDDAREYPDDVWQ